MHNTKIAGTNILHDMDVNHKRQMAKVEDEGDEDEDDEDDGIDIEDEE